MLLLITGPTGAGKTTMCRAFHELGAPCLMPGQHFRDTARAGEFAVSDNPTAPASCEDEVRAMLREFTSVHNGQPHPLVVDGMPRSGDQVSWLFEHFQGAVIFMETDREIRRARLEKRDAGDEAARQLAVVRMVNDTRAMQDMMEAIRVVMLSGKGLLGVSVVTNDNGLSELRRQAGSLHEFFCGLGPVPHVRG